MSQFIFYREKAVKLCFNFLHYLCMLYLWVRGTNKDVEILNLDKSKFAAHREHNEGEKKPSLEYLAFRRLLLLARSDNATLDGVRAGAVSGILSDLSAEYPKKIHKIKSEREKRLDFEVYEYRSRGVSENKRDGAILRFHGGGYCAGNALSYAGVASRLSKQCNLPVFVADYGLCPELTMEEQMDQCVKTFFWLTEERGFAREKIVIYGESAGGGLSLGVILRLGKMGKQVAGGVLISPFVDFRATSSSHIINRDVEELLVPSSFTVFRKCCSSGGKVREFAYVDEEFVNLPPIYLCAGETEVLYCDSLMVRDKARESGAKVHFESFPYGIHCYPLFSDLVPEYQKSSLGICNFIKKTISN